jgi:hypothetical protein
MLQAGFEYLAIAAACAARFRLRAALIREAKIYLTDFCASQ